MKFSDIISQLSPESHSLNQNPELNPEIVTITPIQGAIAHSISYIEGGKFAKMVATTPASALILPCDQTLQENATNRGIAWLSSSYPRLTFAQTIELFYQPHRPEAKIHPKAVIDDGVIMGKNVAIGANAVIGEGVTVGDDVVIHPNVVVYPHCVVGDRTELHSNCSINERTQIGADCVIQSGAVIGAEGFGFVPVPQGWYKMPQSGYVILEDGVEIGCNSTVDRPAVGTTTIGKNTKLDNLVHIGHNCQIGENCAFAGQVGLAGGVTVGNRVILGGQVGIANQAVIGDGAIASAQTGISSNVKSGETVSGTPSMPHKLYLKVAGMYKYLPDMYKFYKELKRNNQN
ncbi:UDP-3-O-(3-hydroxymyristoyl)glucosamine N-acyltransferase [Cyanobacterium sp. IPPAS B-1200]|uniref:UDP-3-O-(3-hydroxymyristoyl)glucosamine N-acyltransferase n=1 Tax=Cyanobacterium sp. IPPAS B-1200 TaxID=1562720 RepID=UPI00085259F6|nr:UDP-3-O-(3-hydroxymyristoyl)glucosamine N-acyltransferase [Cyanobacterium sp. IPPAS B-1200]OEJ77602.1 UDP-3-O-(3-hydroxymyristoyl)glucosamine N-acyltransferase [Cyanobacterium sp. IPPAS B-1200]